MRAVASEVETSKVRPGSRPRTRPVLLRKSRLRALALENLETRALMATIPGAQVTPPIDVSGSGGNESSPSIAINPANTSQLVGVWTRLAPGLAPGQTVVVEGAVSSNGGVSWTGFT